jgi:hypothetical protein
MTYTKLIEENKVRVTKNKYIKNKIFYNIKT